MTELMLFVGGVSVALLCLGLLFLRGAARMRREDEESPSERGFWS